MNIHILFAEMNTLVRTFCARFVDQEDVDTFDLSADSIDGLAVKDCDDIYIGTTTRAQLELDEGEGIINSSERRDFYK